MQRTDLDRAFARVAALARARNLPGVTEDSSYGTPAFKVSGTTFVRLDEAETLVLHCPDEQKALLMEISPEIYFETPHYVGHAVVLIRLGAIQDEELALRLEDAWRFKAPAKLAAQRPLTPPASD